MDKKDGSRIVKVFIAILLITISSCSTTKDFRDLYGSMKEKNFVKSYKVAMVYGCINEGTNGNLNRFIKENNDLGLFSEVEFLSHGIVKQADSIGRVFSKRLRPINYADAGDGVPYFSGCIYLAFSNEGESIADKKLNELRKAKLEYIYEE